MSLIFGVVSRAGAPVPEDWLPRAESAAQWLADETQRMCDTSAAFFCRQRRTTPWMRHSAPIVGDAGTTLLFDGRIDNRTELAAELGLRTVEQMSDAKLALAGWHAFGERLAERLLGDFAIAIRDRPSQTLVLIRDHMGARPLFICEAAGFVAFASSIPPLLTLPFCDRRWDPTWVVDYLEEVKPDAEYTGFRGVRAAPPAHLLRFGTGETLRHRFWSLPVVTNPISIAREDAVTRTRALLERAVEDRLVCGAGRIACELSGGLDSSSIAVIAAGQLAAKSERLIGVTQATPSAFRTRFDSMADLPFAEAVYAYEARIERMDVFNETPSMLDMLRHTLERHGAPPRNDFNGFAVDAPDMLAARDARVLLSGYGGDQLVTAGGAGLAEGLLEERQWRALAGLFRRPFGRRAMIRRLLLEIPGLRALVAPIDPPRRPAPSLASEAAHAATGYPARAHLHPMPPWQGTLRRRDEQNLVRPVMSYRLQDSQVGAGARGVEYRYPLLDVRLLEFVHSLPTLYRIAPDDPRVLIRDVMAGRLPDKVRQRRDKYGMTVPGIFVNVVRHAGELRTHLQAMRADAITAAYAQYDDVLRALDLTLATGEFPKDTANKAGETYRGATQGQVLRLTMLGLWTELHNVEPVPLEDVQANQAV